MTKQRINQIVGSIGAFIGIIVFIAYIPQIIPNSAGVILGGLTFLTAL